MPNEMDLIVSLLRTLTKEVESLSPDDRNAVSEGKATIRIIVEPTLTRERQSVPPPADYSDLIRRLEGCSSREAVEELLQNEKLTKANLLSLTRQLKLPYQKEDKLSRLRERIAESTVGFRLRSQAIQGKPQIDS